MKEKGVPSLLSHIDDKVVHEDMLKNPLSSYWEACREYVLQSVRKQSPRLSLDVQEDITQDALKRIFLSLQHFEGRAALTTWFYQIAQNCVRDHYRKIKREQDIISLGVAPEDKEDRTDFCIVRLARSVEEESVIREELNAISGMLERYLASHSCSQRNREILARYLFNSSSRAEIAQVVGCTPQMVSYVIKGFQRYMRQQVRGE